MNIKDFINEGKVLEINTSKENNETKSKIRKEPIYETILEKIEQFIVMYLVMEYIFYF